MVEHKTSNLKKGDLASPLCVVIGYCLNKNEMFDVLVQPDDLLLVLRANEHEATMLCGTTIVTVPANVSWIIKNECQSL